MADAAVEFLLDNLQQLLNYHVGLIRDVHKNVEALENDLRLFKSFLSRCTKKRRKEDDGLREIIKQIRDVVYEAEDIIDAFVTQAAETKSQSYFRRAFTKPFSLHTIAEEVKEVADKINRIYGDKSLLDFPNFKLGDGEPEEKEVPIVKQENVVGLEDEAETLIGYLKEKTERLDIISIIGMPGLGKTTLAGKIFRDPDIMYEFPTRIWVYVSSECTRKNVFLTILGEFTKVTDEMRNKNDEELASMVRDRLHTGKFLIVMDDVWTPVDWNNLRIALPVNNNMGKVLITSRDEKVARYANVNRPPHNLRFLTHDESWLLLQYEVFAKPTCPTDLQLSGKHIATQCGGLPLAIVVIGGILVTKTKIEDMDATGKAWNKVAENVSQYLTQEDPSKRMEKIIALSYEKLPIHLRACFLYLAMFPEDFEIPVWKLTRMWIAEGFITQQKGKASLEETAENYLDELISRNLVRIDKLKRDGKVKTCRIHDMLRDFCKNEAGSEIENFLQEVKKSEEGHTFDPPPETIKNRRLCIHKNVSSFAALKPYGPRVRSFVSFCDEDINLPPELISAIPAAFKLLRVLEAKPIKFSKIPSDMYHLVHLRYITISFTLTVLPPALSKLWNIQTLVVDTTSRTLEIKADIWNMKQLRHLKTNASASLPKPKSSKSGKEGEKLQTLGTISPQSCTEDILHMARFLKKLGIRGRLAILLEGKTGSTSFENLWKLDNLEKLKLLNDVFPDPPSEGKLRALPPPYRFPPKLRSLTLSDTFLDWTHMSTLGLLQNLEVLKLKEKAFEGRKWEVTEGGFLRLEVLHIGRTDLVSWVAYSRHFPSLKRLELYNCEKLLEVPEGLADIPDFHVLDLYRTNIAANSAKKIKAAKDAKLQDPKASNFKLYIFPRDEDKVSQNWQG